MLKSTATTASITLPEQVRQYLQAVGTDDDVFAIAEKGEEMKICVVQQGTKYLRVLRDYSRSDILVESIFSGNANGVVYCTTGVLVSRPV